jgi:hypothetical protein
MGQNSHAARPLGGGFTFRKSPAEALGYITLGNRALTWQSSSLHLRAQIYGGNQTKKGGPHCYFRGVK